VTATQPPPRISGRSIALIVALAGYILPFFIHLPGLPEAGHRLLSVFLLAVVLWVTEAIPLFATSALVILLLVTTLSQAAEPLLWGLPTGFTGGTAPDFTEYLNSLADKVLILFLGGFFLAMGAAKFGLDRNLASLMLRPFGSKPSRVLLGLMLITGILSMWMSNTATCATIMAVVLPIIHRLDASDRFRCALALGVPFSANLGGMATPVGSPPNAIALAALNDAGSCSFPQWMMFALPLTLVLLAAAWLILLLLFPTQTRAIDLTLAAKWNRSTQAWIYYLTAATTIVLWMTETLHGVNSYIVGLFPVAVLLATQVVTTREFRSLEWDVLWLVAGGIALGKAVAATGFDQWIVSLVDWTSVPGFALGGLLALAALTLSTFISNSAATNLLAPMAVAVAVSLGTGPVAAVASVALGSSLAMCLPISTPPNAIAYASGAVKTRDMAIAGAAIGGVGAVVVLLLLPVLLRWSGIH
jgi:solute carrier family 13 (sodium-dependent dicarboxylate transporter), member 2/3/5